MTYSKEQLTGLDLTAFGNLDDRLDCRTVMLRAVEKRGRYGQQNISVSLGGGGVCLCAGVSQKYFHKN